MVLAQVRTTIWSLCLVGIIVASVAISSSSEAPPTTAAAATAVACEPAPRHAQPADASYALTVAGEPDLFLPGELYTVSLKGVNNGQGHKPFVGFTIWAEIEAGENDDLSGDLSANQSLGLFQSYDAQTQALDLCSPAVTNATAHPKTEIQVIWNAPAAARDLCLRLCARAGPAGSSPTTWSVLARKLCATPATPASIARQPPIVEPCCACDEAKYEVTFEGLWSRNTHPRDFPPEDARAHFGEVIGASHTAQYRVWQEGRVASPGLRRLAADGATTALEKELKAESDHIRTIIKARGISWQQVGGSGTPSTFAVFRVDGRHHLVSLAAKLAPSPDWIVGVSALELCNANCTWSRSASLPLYPYDAGTDSGLAYTALEQPTVPAAPVRALRPDWPRDERSPFFDAGGAMRPFARLRLTRLRLYEKSCDAVEAGVERAAELVSSGVGVSAVSSGGGAGVGGSCATHEWGAWSACSASCGPGRAARQRRYMWPARALADACRVPLTDHRACYGPRRHCRAPTEYEPDPAESSGPCAVSQWSEWSPCEGCGVRARTRHYVAARALKRCHVGYRSRTVMHQAMPCDAGPCYIPPSIPANTTNFDWFYKEKLRGDCPVTSWSEWSPCSARCGRGRRLRTRLYVVQDSALQQELSKRLFNNWSQRFVELQGIDAPAKNITADDPNLEEQVQGYLFRCEFTQTLQEALCDGDDASCQQNFTAEQCKLPMSVGPCRGYEERWFFDYKTKTCEPFGFTGCGGNANNFRDRERCRKACFNLNSSIPATDSVTNNATVNATINASFIATVHAKVNAIVNATVTTTTETTVKSTKNVAAQPVRVPSINEISTKRNKPLVLKKDNEVLLHDEPAPAHLDVDCETSAWGGWSSCFGECDFSIKLNYRTILRIPSGTGKPCPRLVKSRTCRLYHCRKSVSQHRAPDRGAKYNY